MAEPVGETTAAVSATENMVSAGAFSAAQVLVSAMTDDVSNITATALKP